MTQTVIDGIGIYFENYFDPSEKNLFNLIESNHQFQSLTESNKETSAFRSGLYLSKVETFYNDLQLASGNLNVSFNLLRCSTNFNGPTDNFADIDNEIIEKLNETRKQLYPDSAEFNHVLAQIYNNISTSKKAKIKQHSDKTKDMPENGLIAFCTFYKNLKSDVTEGCLTTLRFKLKDVVPASEISKLNLQKKVDILLHPNSVLIIPLSTNRLYTHEIVPSALPVGQIPTRMGYVVRCSNVKGVYTDQGTFIQNSQGIYKQLQKGTNEDIKMLKNYYYQENTQCEKVLYPEINFSMNEGDYLKPFQGLRL